MRNLNFPIQFIFKISSLSNDFTAVDASGELVAYVRQKMFKLKEAINIFSDEQQSELLYTINADKWIDFSTAYQIVKRDGSKLGKVARKGWSSIWKVNYEIIDENEQLQFHIREENGWVKVMDSLVGEIPILNFFTGYLFNPSYIVTDLNDRPVVRLKKQQSFWGRKFEISRLEDFDDDDGERIMLCLMMMILLERRRG